MFYDLEKMIWYTDLHGGPEDPFVAPTRVESVLTLFNNAAPPQNCTDAAGAASKCFNMSEYAFDFAVVTLAESVGELALAPRACGCLSL